MYWGSLLRRSWAVQIRHVRSHHRVMPTFSCLSSRGLHVTRSRRTYDVRKVELTPLEQRKLTFDSHALVKELEFNGFEKKQAELIVSALVTLTTANMDIVYRDMVTGAHQEIALQQIMAHLDSIRKDMVILEKSEFANLRSENSKMKIELEQIKNRLLEESQKISADTKLDINLERSRVTDMFTEQEKKLMEVSSEFHKKNAEIESSAIETTKKLDIEVASLKTLLESLKLQTIRYLAEFWGVPVEIRGYSVTTVLVKSRRPNVQFPIHPKGWFSRVEVSRSSTPYLSGAAKENLLFPH